MTREVTAVPTRPGGIGYESFLDITASPVVAIRRADLGITVEFADELDVATVDAVRDRMDPNQEKARSDLAALRDAAMADPVDLAAVRALSVALADFILGET